MSHLIGEINEIGQPEWLRIRMFIHLSFALSFPFLCFINCFTSTLNIMLLSNIKNELIKITVHLHSTIVHQYMKTLNIAIIHCCKKLQNFSGSDPF